MVTIFNKSNRPIGVAGQSVLPSKEIKIKDKDAYCSVFDENGKNTGNRELLPGLVALEQVGFITIKIEEEVKPTHVVETVAEESVVEEAAEKPKRKYTKKTEKTEE